MKKQTRTLSVDQINLVYSIKNNRRRLAELDSRILPLKLDLERKEAIKVMLEEDIKKAERKLIGK